jgi:hypothetical protein
VETLHTEAAVRQLERNRDLFVQVPADGALTDRIEALVEVHDRLYEAVAPVRRAALRAAPDSDALQKQLRLARAWVRADIDRIFATELEERGDPTTVAALEVAFSFEAWDQCTSAQSLEAPDRKAAISRLAHAIIG